MKINIWDNPESYNRFMSCGVVVCAALSILLIIATVLYLHKELRFISYTAHKEMRHNHTMAIDRVSGDIVELVQEGQPTPDHGFEWYNFDGKINRPANQKINIKQFNFKIIGQINK